MNAFLALLLGFALGLVVCWSYFYRLHRRLRDLLLLLPPHLNESSSLPLISRLRRAIKLATEEYRQQSAQIERLERILEAAPLGYLEVDAADQLQWCNAVSRQLLRIDRWRPGQARLLLELVRSYELDRLVSVTRATGEPQVKDWVYQATSWQEEPGGAATSLPYAIALQATSLPLDEGAVGVFLIDRQQLVELQQSRDHTFADLAHELRTPLTAIQLVAETLEARLDPPEGDWAHQMLAEVERLMALVQDYLDISQLHDRAEAILECEVLELEPLIRQTWERLAPLAEAKGLKLDYLGPPTCRLRGDRRRLAQVWLNLLDNAIKHSPPQSAIQMRVALQPPLAGAAAEVVVDAIDAGQGFAAADLEHVFERLYRSDTARQRDSALVAGARARRGSGLGLAIAREIVAAHGGSIIARNHPETGGAWLQVRLPSFH